MHDTGAFAVARLGLLITISGPLAGPRPQDPISKHPGPRYAYGAFEVS